MALPKKRYLSGSAIALKAGRYPRDILRLVDRGELEPDATQAGRALFLEGRLDEIRELLETTPAGAVNFEC